jgi:hypothetical protein
MDRSSGSGRWFATAATALTLSLISGWCLSASATLSAVSATVSDDSVPGDPAVPTTSGTPLPFSDTWSGGLVVDEVHGHVFVSAGEPDAALVVADLDGEVVQVLPGLVGAEGMLLSGDGSTLYVALSQGRAIAAVDTATLQARAYATGTAVCPKRLAELGHDVYFTASCSGRYLDVWRLDPGTGAVDPVSFPDEVDSVMQDAGPIASSPAYPRRLFVVDNDYPPPGSADGKAVLSYELDDTGLTATRVAARTQLDPRGHYAINGLAFSDDGQALLAPNMAKVSVLSPSDLSTVRDLWSDWDAIGASMNQGFVATGQSFYTGDSRIYVHTSSGLSVRTYFFDGPTWFGSDSVKFAAGRLYALAEHEGSVRLYTFADFTTPAPKIRHSGIDTTSAGDPVHFGGTATVLDEPFAGHELQVWRHGLDGWVALPPVVTAADGTFAIGDTPDKGNYSYVVLYPGAPGFAPERHRWHHTVLALNSTISLDEPQPTVFRPGDPIRISGSLTAAGSGEPIAGAEVTVTQTHNAQATTLPSVTTDPDGRFSFETSGEDLGEYRFTARYGGDGTYKQSVREASAWVKEPASIELPQPQPNALQLKTMRFHGRLTTHDGQPVPNQRVSWGRYPSGWSNPQEAGSTTTDADGYFSFTDQATTTKVVRWRVSYTGDAANDVASTETSLPVYSGIPAIEIRTNRPVHTYDTVATVEARLPDGAGGTVKLFMQPYGRTEYLLADGTATTGPDAVASLRVTRNATLTAIFEPHTDRYYYAPNRVSVPMPVRPRLQQTLLGTHSRDRRTYLVRTRVDPWLNLEVAPALPGRCAQVQVQRYRNGAYRAVQNTPCIPLNRYSRARWQLAVDPPPGAKFRLRYKVAGDKEYTAALASWVKLRFTR